MAESLAGGVAYTVNPLDREDTCIHIVSTWGVAKGVVDGTAACDQFTVEKKNPPEIVARSVPLKNMALVCSAAEGVRRMSVDERQQAEATLNDAQILQLAETAARVEAHYGCPQDIGGHRRDSSSIRT